MYSTREHIGILCPFCILDNMFLALPSGKTGKYVNMEIGKQVENGLWDLCV